MSKRFALMSIHPKYANAILDGSKRVEFRKRRLPDDIDRVVIYATSPIKAVVGEFMVREQVTNTPSALWREFGNYGVGVSRDALMVYFEDFRGYFAGRQNESRGTAIVIASPITYDEPRPLADYGIVHPPQSWRYLTEEEER